MKIDLAILNRQFEIYQAEYEQAALKALRSGWYVLGREVAAFEKEFADYVGAKFCVGVNSGLDALTLSLRALKIGTGDEVIVPANTYIATVLAITANGAVPVLVEPDEFYNLDSSKLARALTKRTKAIMVVHLYGQAADMENIARFSRENNLRLAEDCAQSHGACFNGKMTGTFGDAGCFSFYPTKNLGAFGDGGAVVTDNADLAQTLMKLRNYGNKVKYHNELEGVNSRLDELQAALLRVKLSHLDALNDERKRIADRYFAAIKNPALTLPQIRKGAEHVFHQFVIRTEKRDDFKDYLERNGIKTVIHYPIPPHLSECYRRLGFKRGDFPLTERYADEVLSLPIFNGMTDAEIDFVTGVCNEYNA